MPPVTDLAQLVPRFREAFLAADADALGDLYEDDAFFYAAAHEHLAQGRAAIADMFRARFQAATPLDIRCLERDEHIEGDYAFAHSVWQSRSRNNDSGEETTGQVRTTEVIHRGPDGGWRFIIDHV